MSGYTLAIEACDTQSVPPVWQLVGDVETTTDIEGFTGDADQAAELVAYHQNMVEGPGWRVRVWYGINADTRFTADGEWYAPDEDDEDDE